MSNGTSVKYHGIGKRGSVPEGINKIFDNHLEELLGDINQALWEETGS